MYSVSNDFIAAAKSQIQKYDLRGTIDGVSFSAADVAEGSVTISNRITDSSAFSLGGVFVGELDISFIDSAVQRSTWAGKAITLEVGLWTGSEFEYIPVGTYYVDSAKHKDNVTSVVAYDAMSKFDSGASVAVGAYGTAYEWLTLACTACNVTLGMTQEDVEALPNGIYTLSVDDAGDIETWRDVVSWVAVTLGCFATIDRSGALILKSWHDTVDDTVPATARHTATYGDEAITYTGLYVTVLSSGVSEYHAAAVDDGYTLSIGANPFMQGSRYTRGLLAQNILAALGSVCYTDFSLSLPFGMHYDLGDVIAFPGGSGSSTDKFCLMAYSWTYGRNFKASGIPGKKKSMSKTDKNIQGLLNNVSANEMAFYEIRNAGKITIPDDEQKRIVRLKIASKVSTRALINLEINLKSTATDSTEVVAVENDEVAGKDVFGVVSAGTTKAIVTYKVDNDEHDLHPQEGYLDGYHVLHLMFVCPLVENTTTIFAAYMRAQGGEIEIGQGGLWLYASGLGLVGDGEWNGEIEVEEEAVGWTLVEPTFEGATETVLVAVANIVKIEASDTVTAYAVADPTFEDATDSIRMVVNSHVYDRVTEEGEYERVTEEGYSRVTEDEDGGGD